LQFPIKLTCGFFSFSERDDEKKKLKKKRVKKKENVPTSEIAVCPGGGIV
jgi:hypothetical protein